MTDIKWIKSQKGNNIPVIDGHRFKRNRSKGDKIFWKCERKGCRTNAITISGLLTSQTGSHSHCLRTATNATTATPTKRRTQSKKGAKANSAAAKTKEASAASSSQNIEDPQSYLNIEGTGDAVSTVAMCVTSFPSATSTTTTTTTTTEEHVKTENVEMVTIEPQQQQQYGEENTVEGIWLKTMDGRRFLVNVMQDREGNLN